MAEKKFRVVFSGKLAEGETLQKEKQQLAALFKIPEEKADALFKKNRSIIKQDLDLKTAQKYVQALASRGAVCMIEPMAPADESPQAAAERNDEKQTKQGPRVVSLSLAEAQIGFSPFVISKITGTPDGLNFNRAGMPETPFEQIRGLAVISQSAGLEEKLSLLLFRASEKRPFLCDAKNIAYTDFPIKREASAIITLRHFIRFLCEQNPGLAIEKNSFDFLSGKPLKRLNPDDVLKLATGLGKSL